MDVQPWMLLVPPALSAGAIPLARRHALAAWVTWALLTVISIAGVVLFAAGAAFLQTVVGAGMALSRGEADGARGHVDLRFLAPWSLAVLVILVGTAAAVVRVRRTDVEPPGGGGA